MPLFSAVAAVTPKVGAALAALAISADDGVHISSDVETHATSFLHLPIPKQRLWKMILAPEIAVYRWGHDLWNRLSGHGLPDPGRMVEFYAGGCSHCKHTDPVWNDAVKMWSDQEREHSGSVVWEQKQCYDESWRPGRDHEECKEQGIIRFPSVKFYGPGKTTGEDFLIARTPEKLVAFAKTGIFPEQGLMPRLPGDVSDMKFVDFFSATCPHCKALKTVWEDAHVQWDKVAAESELNSRVDAPLIKFEKKECYDDHGNPGKDIAECNKYHIKSSSNLKLFVPDVNGHGFRPVEYTGARTTEAIINFLKEHAGMPTKPSSSGQGLIGVQVPPAVVSKVESARFLHEPIGVWVPKAVRAEVMAAGVNVPESVKAAAVAARGQTHSSDADSAALQGDTPASQHSPEATAADGLGKERSPRVLSQTVKAAMMPLALSYCPSERLSLAAAASRPKLRLSPEAISRFI
mmetsp:Transcript_93104/g.145240  ORF Transcript_93104/g.145240 Transcript_93104/m.145240 type:complete len:463 (+) Transcript_93104:55-1443(+)